jgi:hypothetical protein
MPNRIDKLLETLSSSSIMEKHMLIAAILKRRLDTSRWREALIDDLMSFEKGPGFAQEKKEYRLYARLTLVLAGMVRSPVYDVQPLTELSMNFDAKYGDVRYAKEQYGQFRACASSIQTVRSCALTPKLLGGAMAATHMDATVVDRLCQDAWRTARDTLRIASQALTQADKQAKANYAKWFGALTADRYDTVTSNMGLICDAMEELNITLDWEVKDVWATAVPNGIKDNSPLQLGKKFFSDATSCLHSTDRAAVTNWATVEKLYVEREQLSIAKTAADQELTPLELKHTHIMSAFTKKTITAQVRDKRLAELNGSLSARRNAVKAAQDQYNAFQTNNSRLIARYGTIIHEMSHWTVSTDDVNMGLITKGAGGRVLSSPTDVDCYGANVCARLAEVAPEKAINNADNYRIFCEQYGP